MPARYRYDDVLPQPLPLVLEDALDEPPSLPNSPQLAPLSLTSPPNTSVVVSRIRKFIRTHRNSFGLFRRYRSEKLPSHDPEKFLELIDLTDRTIPTTIDSTSESNLSPSQNTYYPYPNRSSFLLGDWQWNNGVQKSQESFNDLLSIVGSSDFKPDDVRGTQWAKINAKLALNEFDGISIVDDEDEAEWTDVDTGWKRSPIRISVPFHSRAESPGSKDYTVGDLYHRSLVSVIREKLSNPQDNEGFHYEPFELFWKRTKSSDKIRIHGELYTSPAFLDAHREVQELPGEPDCDLPRVVAAMMFWSDATHLTSFGNAKLWPCYLYFGNESKYRRCKPTSHLCNHVAYFQTVHQAFVNLTRILTVTFSVASGRIQRRCYRAHGKKHKQGIDDSLSS